jgi:predicted PurR-regulated permease PerM
MLAKRVFVATVVVLLTLLGAYLVMRLMSLIVLLLVAFVFASAISPLVRRLNRRLGLGVSIGVVYVVLAALAAGAFAIILTPLVQQASTLFASTDDLLTEVQNQIDTLRVQFRVPELLPELDLREAYNYLLNQAPSLAVGVLNYTLGAITAVFSALIVLVVAFYWLLERRNIESTWLRLVPRHSQREARQIIEEIEDKAGGYVRGVTTLAAIMSVLSYVSLTLVGRFTGSETLVRYTLVLALVAGLAEFVPLAGPFIAAAPAILIAFADSPFEALVVAIVYFVLQQFENNLLVPKVMQHSVGLSPLTTLVAVLSGTALLGVVGALLSVPVASAIKIVLNHTLLARREDTTAGERRLVGARGT